MLIQKKRVNRLKKYVSSFLEGTELRIVVAGVDRFVSQIDSLKLSESSSVIPEKYTRACKNNFEGITIVRRDLPKIPYDLELPYELEDWGGNVHRGVNYIPKMKYQRDFISPPQIALAIVERDGEKIIVSDKIQNTTDNELVLKNTINMFLEIFGEAIIIDESIGINMPELVHYDWEFLPVGEFPWDRVKEKVLNYTRKKYSSEIQEFIKKRWDFIKAFSPTRTGTGLRGFAGYIVFEFPDKGIYVLESGFLGNATYIFGKNWTEVSKLSKSQVINGNLCISRIVHGPNWESQINSEMA